MCNAMFDPNLIDIHDFTVRAIASHTGSQGHSTHFLGLNRVGRSYQSIRTNSI
ncbi:hypothetical protein IQ268_09760 [Oculatella sp. LEGE 06141]|uniref:hypothetical protein n=1 Tax=Oculatella sp. LEGE 06141 TaxID=1828648 RepID=UPI0018825757|nr:hypothetical protein [Oculatella sp. LEGE 06141]MBE9178844.1 hypothetical protein [Oculatella sp. LEGE 06141]